MGTNEGTNFSNRQIPYGFVVVLAQELRARECQVKDCECRTRLPRKKLDS